MSHCNAFLAHAGRLELARCLCAVPLKGSMFSVPAAARWSTGNWVNPVWKTPQASLATCPRRTGISTQRSCWDCRVEAVGGPARIAYHLHLNTTVHRILTRCLRPPLRFTDPATGIRVRGRSVAADTNMHGRATRAPAAVLAEAEIRLKRIRPAGPGSTARSSASTASLTRMGLREGQWLRKRMPGLLPGLHRALQSLATHRTPRRFANQPG